MNDIEVLYDICVMLRDMFSIMTNKSNYELGYVPSLRERMAKSEKNKIDHMQSMNIY